MLPVALIGFSIGLSQWPEPEGPGTPAGRSTLAQNYPNPFNPSTSIQYSLGKAGMVSLRLFNLLGVEVATLVSGRQEAGSYDIRLDAGEGAPRLTSGVYFYRLEAGTTVLTRKMVLLN